MPRALEELDRAKAVLLHAAEDGRHPLHVLDAGVWSRVFAAAEAWALRRALEFGGVPCMVSGTDGPGGLHVPHLHPRRTSFPPPRDIKVNMMPFRLYSPHRTLPEELQGYLDLVWACRAAGFEDGDYMSATERVAYLTVHEGWVEPGRAQRRPGLHIECPGEVVRGGRWVRGTWDTIDECGRDVMWGGGLCGWSEEHGYVVPVDGIFMASTVAGTCAVYPCLVKDPTDVGGRFGDVERLRPHMPPPVLLDAGQVAWITDRTPHESLPVDKRVYRQFFRVVVGKISAWYSKHNTPNPLGVLPDAPICDVDKFAE